MPALLRCALASPRLPHPDANGLDISYVTPRIIVSSAPSAQYPKRAYRIPLDQLITYLDTTHGPQNWHIWEFRAEGTGYPDSLVRNQISHAQWPDHQPPPFHLLLRIISHISLWLEPSPTTVKQEATTCSSSTTTTTTLTTSPNTTSTTTTTTTKKLLSRSPSYPPPPPSPDSSHSTLFPPVALFHCKAGKGRSGTITCAYLIAQQAWSLSDALDRFTTRRMRPGFGPGVSIPSQLRWLQYLDRWARYVGRRQLTYSSCPSDSDSTNLNNSNANIPSSSTSDELAYNPSSSTPTSPPPTTSSITITANQTFHDIFPIRPVEVLSVRIINPRSRTGLIVALRGFSLTSPPLATLASPCDNPQPLSHSQSLPGLNERYTLQTLHIFSPSEIQSSLTLPLTRNVKFAPAFPKWSSPKSSPLPTATTISSSTLSSKPIHPSSLIPPQAPGVTILAHGEAGITTSSCPKIHDTIDQSTPSVNASVNSSLPSTNSIISSKASLVQSFSSAPSTFATSSDPASHSDLESIQDLDNPDPSNVLVFRPQKPVRFNTSDINVIVKRRHFCRRTTCKSYGTCVTSTLPSPPCETINGLLSSTAHAWFNAWFEGQGPERYASQSLPAKPDPSSTSHLTLPSNSHTSLHQNNNVPDLEAEFTSQSIQNSPTTAADISKSLYHSPKLSGTFRCDWDEMDGLKGLRHKGIRAFDRIIVEWRFADSPPTLPRPETFFDATDHPASTQS